MRQPSVFVLLLLPVLLVTGSSPALAQDSMNRSTITSIARPERTDAGVFDGTWYYVQRDGRMALWARGNAGKLELKIRYQSAQGLESFETDLTTGADYDLSGKPARFSIEMSQADENTVEGHWFWEVKSRKASRLEEGDFTMYRAGDGRQLVMDFSSFQKKLTSQGRSGGYEGPLIWHFNKASKRLVRWEELPF